MSDDKYYLRLESLFSEGEPGEVEPAGETPTAGAADLETMQARIAELEAAAAEARVQVAREHEGREALEVEIASLRARLAEAVADKAELQLSAALSTQLPESPALAAERAPRSVPDEVALQALASIPISMRTRAEVCAAALDRATRVLGADLAAIYVREPGDANLLRRQAAAGFPLEQVRELLSLTDGQTDLGARTLVWSAPKPLPFPEDPLREHDSVQAAIGVPIRGDTETLGWLYAGRHEARPFDDVDVSLFDILAARIAGALESLHQAELVQLQADRLRLVDEISRAMTGILDVDELLQSTVDRIAEQFNFYYVGLYLIEDTSQWAVLHAGTGEAGRRQIARGHQLAVGGDSMVGAATGQGVAQIASDVGRTAVHFQNPDLPATRSELALPLHAREQIIGALTIQSADVAAFRQEDIATFQLLADHLATAISNARLVDVTQLRVSELAMLNRLSEALADLSDLPSLYRVVREQITAIFEVRNFYLALYDAERELIEIPLLVERDKQLQIDPVQFGTGLASHIIRTRQPLRLVRDVEEKAHELGALIVGSAGPPLSYLGAPIIVQDRVVGVIGVQDFEREDYFSDADSALLVTVAGQVGLAIENARLFDQTRQRARRLRAATAVSQVATAILDVDELLHTAVVRIRDLFDLYYVGLFLVDDTGDWAVLRAGTGDEGRRQLERSHRLAVGGDSMIGYAIGRDEARIALDVGKEAVRFENPDLPASRSELALPLRVRGVVIGALTVQSALVAAFGQEDIATFQVLADQLAIAIQNARLFEIEQHRRESAAALLNIAQVAASSLGLMELLKRISQRTAQACQAHRCTISLLDGSGELLQMLMSQFADGHEDPDLWQLFKDTTPDRLEDVPLFRDAIRQRRPMLLHHPERTDLMPDKWTTPFGIRKMLVVPLVSRDRPTGALILDHVDPQREFNIEQIDLAQTIGGQIAIAIENARLFEQTEQALAETAQQAHRLAWLNETAAALSETTSVEQAFRVAASKVDLIVGSDRAGVGLLSETGDTFELCALDVLQGTISLGDPLPLAGTLIGAAIRESHLVRAPDLEESDLPDARRMLQQGLRSVLVAPLISGGRVFGTLNVGSRRLHAFDLQAENLLLQVASLLAPTVENRRLFGQTERALAMTEGQARRLALLNEAAAALSETATPNEAYKIAAAKTNEVIGGDRASVALLTDTGDSLDVVAVDGIQGSIPVGAQLPLADTRIEIAIRENRLINTPDLRADDLSDARLLADQGFRSTMIAPLVSAGRPIGTLNVGSRRLNAFNVQDKNLLLQIASLLASTIESRRLFERTERTLEDTEEQARRLAVLNEMSEELGRAGDLAMIVAIATAKIPQILPTKRASVAILNEDGETAQLLANQDAEQYALAGVQIAVKGSIETAVREKRVIVERDVEDSEQPDIRTAMIGALSVGERVIGTLNLGSEDPNAYSARERVLFVQIASLVSAAIENRRLLDQTQRLARREQLINEITTKIRRSADIESILTTTVAELGKAFGVREATVQVGTESELLDDGGRNAGRTDGNRRASAAGEGRT